MKQLFFIVSVVLVLIVSGCTSTYTIPSNPVPEGFTEFAKEYHMISNPMIIDGKLTYYTQGYEYSIVHGDQEYGLE